MKLIKISLVGVVLLMTHAPTQATTISGNLYTEFYSYESKIPEANSHLRSLQGFRLNVKDVFKPGFSAYVNGRLASDISTKLSNDPDYRVFGAYLQYAPKSRKFMARAGRQFLYEGLGGFTLDGGKLKVKFGKYLSATAYGGTIPGPSFFTYNQVNRWDRRNAIGGRVNVKATGNTSFNISFLQKNVNDILDSRLIGFDYLCKKERFSSRMRADYDLYNKRLKYISISPRYKCAQGHSVRMEYSYRKASFGANSIFSVIEPNPVHQGRMNWTYKMDKALFGMGNVSYTKYSDRSNLSLRVGVSYNGHSGGIVYSNGYGGSKIGLFGNLRHSLTDKLKLYTNIDMYTTKLDSDLQESQTLVAASFGGRYSLSKQINARVEIQVLTNPLYDYDTRGYLRLDYSLFKKVKNTRQAGGDSK